MNDIDLLPSEIDEDLRTSVRALLTARAAAPEVARVYDENGFDAPAVDAGLFEELELAGLVIPEADGGDGAGLSAAGTVASEIGRAGGPSLLRSSAGAASRGALRAAAAGRRMGADRPGHRPQPPRLLSSAVAAPRVVCRAAAAERRMGADGPAHRLMRRLATDGTTAALAMDVTARKWTGSLHVTANTAGPSAADDPLEPGATVELIGLVHGGADGHRADLLAGPAR